MEKFVYPHLWRRQGCFHSGGMMQKFAARINQKLCPVTHLEKNPKTQSFAAGNENNNYFPMSDVRGRVGRLSLFL